MSRERVSERCALLRLQAFSLSKRRWQDAVGEPRVRSGIWAAPDRFKASGRRRPCDEEDRKDSSYFARKIRAFMPFPELGQKFLFGTRSGPPCARSAPRSR